MTTLSIIALFALVAAAVWVLLLRSADADDEQIQEADDRRVSPLVRGIHHLLSDKPELALQDMVEVAKLRSESTEVYMALGEMFLAQGEIGRAVRIHQNILARPEVPQDLYLQAHFALGKDFQTGGLLDRALRHYQKVLDVQSDHLDALKACLRIREQSHEWEEAESLLSRIERIQSDDQSLHRAYLWAEMAEEALQQDIEQAASYAQQALDISPQCTHAHLIFVHIAVQQKNMERLQTQVMAMQQQTPQDIHLLVPLLAEQYTDVLMQCWQQTGQDELALTWLETCSDAEQRKKLQHQLQFSPKHLQASLRLSALALMGDDVTLQQQAAAWRHTLKRYHCHQCGVQLRDMHWQCPQCHTWGSCDVHEDHKETV